MGTDPRCSFPLGPSRQALFPEAAQPAQLPGSILHTTIKMIDCRACSAMVTVPLDAKPLTGRGRAGKACVAPGLRCTGQAGARRAQFERRAGSPRALFSWLRHAGLSGNNMAARLIETTEEDSFVVVAQFIGQLLDGGEVRGPRVRAHVQRHGAACVARRSMFMPHNSAARSPRRRPSRPRARPRPGRCLPRSARTSTPPTA